MDSTQAVAKPSRTNEILQALVAVCTSDEEFRRRCHYVSGNVRFGIGDEGFILRFFDGKLVSVESDALQTLVWDYEVVGPLKDWERMWRGEIDLAQAIVPQFGSSKVRGNRIKYGSDVEAIVHISKLLRVAAQRCGVDVLPARPPAPVAKDTSWNTKHEVVGRYVNVDGVRTYYETVGERRGPIAFIGIHTAGRDCRQFQQIGDVLAPYGRFVSFDRPGALKSWPMPGNRCITSMAEMSSFTWAFRKALGIDIPTVVMGCSVGGNIVFQLAGDYADDVAAMVSMQGADYTPTQPPSARVLMNHPQVNPAYHFIDRTLGLTGDRTPAHVRDYLEWEVRNYSSVRIQADLTAYSEFDYRNRMHQIRCPSLLVRGKADWIVADDMVDGAASRLVNAKSVEVVKPEGIGHFAHYEQPVEMGNLIIDFLLKNSVIKERIEV